MPSDRKAFIVLSVESSPPGPGTSPGFPCSFLSFSTKDTA